jgi:hypothetical protein
MNGFKENFLQKLKALDSLHLSAGNYAICGSGPLAIRNLRSADDIDIVVRSGLWATLSKKYKPYDELHIRIGTIEVWGDFINLTHRLEEIIDNAELMDGYPFVTLDDTILWKQFLNRPKDQRDIALIKEFLGA